MKSTTLAFFASLGPLLRTVMRYLIRFPGWTGGGRLLLLTDRSARRCTVTVAVAELFVETGSGDGFAVVPSVTVALLLRRLPPSAAGVTLTTSVNVADPALARLPMVAVTVPALPTAGVVHVHPEAHVRETNVVPAG